MKIVVSVKQVPDTTAEKSLDPQTKRLVRTSVENVLNPFDEYAIEEALRLRESVGGDSTVTIVTIAPASGSEIVRKALGMGADNAALLSDNAIGGSDTMATALLLARALRNVGFDLILTGTQSTDAINSVVPAAVAEHLKIPCLTYAKKVTLNDGRVEIARETESGFWRVTAPLPALISVTKGINEPRYPTLKGIMGAKRKEIKALNVSELGVEADKVGDAGSKTRVLSFASVGARAKGTVVTASDPKEGAQRILDFLIEKKVI